jgi:3-hydroxymyristoyl/3-hydroxydecanoyl-(acyl carrier protein) dehydratase
MLMDYFYTVVSKEKDKAIIKLSDKEHPIFKAHFPNKPIMPGFVNFEIVEDVFNLKITTIKRAKFLQTALPNQTLTYIKDNMKFKVYRDEVEIANFSL